MNKVLTVVKNSLPILVLLASGIHAQSQPLSLADVIKRSAREIEETLPQGAKVAILNFDSPSKAFSDYAIDELTGELIEGRKITVVDRSNIEHLMKEMEFQMSGHVSDESIQKIGRMLGAQAMVTGALTDMGTHHRFRVRLINLETAAIQMQTTLELRRDDPQIAFIIDGKKPKKVKVKKRDHYFAAKWMPPITEETSCGWALNLEYGQIWGKGWSLGIDAGGGTRISSEAPYDAIGGGGFNFGYIHYLPNQLQLAYGGSVGAWLARWERDHTHNIFMGHFGPFVKIRWRFAEVSYRGIVGGKFNDEHRGDPGNYISQLMLGVHFQTSKRVR